MENTKTITELLIELVADMEKYTKAIDDHTEAIAQLAESIGEGL